MLMVKENLRSSMRLFRFKHKILWIMVFTFAFVSLYSLAAILSSEFFEQNDFNDSYTHILDDFSNLLFFLTVFSSAVLAFSYKSRSIPFRIYPQTREQRFFTEYILNFLLVLASTAILLVYYLLEYLACKILQHNDIIGTFVFRTNKEFFLYGLVHYALELWLCTALIGFLLALFRFLRQYTILLIAGLAAVALAAMRSNRLLHTIHNGFDFIRADSTLPPFLLKASLLIVLLTAAAFVLNHYAKESNPTRASAALQALSILIGISIALFSIPQLVLSVSEQNTNSSVDFGESESKTRTFTVDTTSLPAGTELTVKLSGKMVDAAGLDFENEDVDMAAIYYDTSVPLMTGAHNLEITYSPMFSTYESMRVSDYMDGTLTATLEGTTLYLNYQTTGDIAVIPVWNTAPNISRFSEYCEVDDGSSAATGASMDITAK